MPALKYRATMPKPDDPDILESIYNDIKQGIPMRYAAIRAGISESAAYHWRSAGEQLLQQSNENINELGSIGRFVQTVKEAEAECVASRLAAADAAEGNNWQKHITVLERRYPKDFGRNQQVTIESNSTVTYVHELGPAAERAIGVDRIPEEMILKGK